MGELYKRKTQDIKERKLVISENTKKPTHNKVKFKQQTAKTSENIKRQ